MSGVSKIVLIFPKTKLFDWKGLKSILKHFWKFWFGCKLKIIFHRVEPVRNICKQTFSIESKRKVQEFLLFFAFSFKNVTQRRKRRGKSILEIPIPQCENYSIFVTQIDRFYVKSILENLEARKLSFLPFIGL